MSKDIIEEVFNKPIPFDGNRYWCPVCLKVYKRKKNLQNHLDKRQCYSLRDILDGSDIERVMKEITKIIYNRESIGDTFLKQIPFYDKLALFVSFCKTNRVDPLFYYVYNEARFEKYNVSWILENAMTNKTLREFFEFRRKNPDWNDEEAFMDSYEQRLTEEPLFLIRAFERGDITVKTFKSKFGDLDKYLNEEQIDRVVSNFQR